MYKLVNLHLITLLRGIMSRSYKKTPIIKSCGYGVYGKRLANRKTRKADMDVAFKGGQYKRLYETWDINDFVVFYPKSQAVKDDWMEGWKKWYYRK